MTRHIRSANRLAVHAATSSSRRRIERVLFLSTVWPERSSSAAGVRTSDLVSSFLERDVGVHFAATSAVDASSKPHVDALERLGARPHHVLPNREDQFVATLGRAQPDVVVFDRFYVEEMFSWMVAKHAPDAMRVLDMQDVHSLRGWREQRLVELLKEQAGQVDLGSVLSAVPPATYDPCLRELSSIYRSDISLVCSPRELEMLTDTFNVPPSLLAEAGFFSDGQRYSGDFSSRKNVVMIGNFLHPPNKDSVIWACTELWPAIRAQIGDDARLDVYGAYCNEQALISKIGKPEKLGVNLRGWLPSLDALCDYRLLFAPLRFGAGLKGKVVDAWEHGLPVVTSVIGSEGMGIRDGRRDQQETWGGAGTATTADQLISDTFRLYTRPDAWTAAQTRAKKLLTALYDRQANLSHIHARFDAVHGDLPAHRAGNYVGGLLAQTNHRSTEYLARWIELKNQK